MDFDGCKWVWFPEGNAREGVPAGTRYFRGHINVPEGRTVSEAAMLITCDNGFVLYANGIEAGMGHPAGEDWRRAKRVDLKKLLRSGENILAVAATNGDVGGPNPAGLIGKYRIVLDNGKTVTGSIDASWLTSNSESSGWEKAEFDDNAWVAAQAVVAYPGGPWGRVTEEGMMLTKSPVEAADPFRGAFTLPDGFDPAQHRVYVTMTPPESEAAARITVNGKYAGGMIGGPFRLNVSQSVQNGENSLLIEPFAPREVQIAVYVK
jgi:alpha-L-rhamnosidase